MFTLFTLVLRHHFFRNAQWLDAKLVPDTQTRQWMKRFQMQLIADGNHWGLYGYAISGRTNFLQSFIRLTDGEPLRFWICQPLANFVMLTDLPVDWQGLLRYGEQFGDDQSGDDHSFGDGKQENYSQSGLHSQSELHSQSKLTAKTVPFNNAPTGAVAEVWLYPQKLIENDHYVISLQSRSSRWEYRLIQRGQLKLNQPQIIDESGKLTFSKPVPYETDSGESGWQVSSGSHCLSLAQVPNQRFKLIDKQVIDAQAGQTIQRTVLPVLPTPVVEQFCAQQEEGDLISVMYVYL
jgi:hypothetical protein